ncbi:hypothetical protein S40285_01354 [Stachybotrys chlorohalonatus IBT 40285]|uniref:Uncharacterized protein n=1 Tax=Stachybotrys chlorohalonatus (strain IBT 40285) TaxID=1283841 RepID=A0A084QLJ3_STAC4|nr:hypothetical protein S40285_01354 [Stachybotrys chlorohalonata IBT 40285]
MAPKDDGLPTSRRRPEKGIMRKLPRIPDNAKVQKRPLNKRPPPASGKSGIIYVSCSTPFMSAVKRVRKQLDSSLRGTGSGSGSVSKHASLESRVAALQRTDGGGGGGGVTVTVIGSGKAIGRALEVASWYEQQADCVVGLKTRTVGTVDDVVVEDDEEVEDTTRVRRVSCLEVTISLK